MTSEVFKNLLVNFSNQIAYNHEKSNHKHCSSTSNLFTDHITCFCTRGTTSHTD